MTVRIDGLLHFAATLVFSVAALACSEADSARKEKPTQAWISQLGDSSAVRRQEAADALGQLGSKAAAAIPDLVRAVADTNPFVRGSAVRAIGLISPEAATDVLRRALEDPHAAVRAEATHALEGFHRRGAQDPPPPEPGDGRDGPLGGKLMPHPGTPKPPQRP